MLKFSYSFSVAITPPSRNFDAHVISFGGTGTTFLLDFLNRRMRANSSDSFNDGIKHANSPNHPILLNQPAKKTVYLYDHPVRAVLSLFRRSYQSHMIPKLRSSMHRNVIEYQQFVNANLFNITLEEFVAGQRDLFGINEHWHNWYSQPLTRDVMFVRFDDLYTSLPELIEYLSLPQQVIQHFPPQKQRHTALDALSPGLMQSLSNIYQETIDSMANLPGVWIRRGTTP